MDLVPRIVTSLSPPFQGATLQTDLLLSALCAARSVRRRFKK
jgi:hypothetical protein